MRQDAINSDIAEPCPTALRHTTLLRYARTETSNHCASKVDFSERRQTANGMPKPIIMTRREVFPVLYSTTYGDMVNVSGIEISLHKAAGRTTSADINCSSMPNTLTTTPNTCAMIPKKSIYTTTTGNKKDTSRQPICSIFFMVGYFSLDRFPMELPRCRLARLRLSYTIHRNGSHCHLLPMERGTYTRQFVRDIHTRQARG